MHHPHFIAIVLGVVAVFVALSIRPLRKAIGLMLIILGTICCFTLIGIIIGIPMIIVGGVLIFM